LQRSSSLTAAAASRLRAQAASFIAIYERHLPLEDAVAFPAAQARLQPAALEAMGEEMRHRRGAAR
jgi:hemerythrin-like domain-containing protein